MKEKHVVFFGPGIDGKTGVIRSLTAPWSLYDLTPIAYPINWKDSEGFKPKLDHFLQVVNKYYRDNCRISVVGLSASGSFMFNALLAKKREVYKAVNVCGRLTVGPISGYRGFSERSKASLAWAESVHSLENQIPSIPSNLKERMMTVQLIYDQLVPDSTSTIEGVRNIRLPWVEHATGGSLAISVLAWPIIKFLQES